MEKINITEKGLIGTLYCPSLPNRMPGIIIFSGSDGGIPGTNAIPDIFIENLANQGFIIFALAYFGADGLPNNLENIHLEYFETAITWLKSIKQVDASKIGMIGLSRGAGLALLLGSMFPDQINSIVAYAPSNMVCGGFPYPNRPAWKYNGKPIAPYISGLSNTDKDLTELADLKLACGNKSSTLCWPDFDNFLRSFSNRVVALISLT